MHLRAHCQRWTIVVSLMALCFTAVPAARDAQAEELRYQWEPSQKFSYNVTVTVDEDEKVTTYKGLITYTVDSASEDQLRFTYRGGLHETSQAKQTDRGSRRPFGAPFGPRGFPGSFGPGGPFSRPTLAGKIQTTNRITMRPNGQVLALEGDSQLPYLLGNVSLLPFELLPKGDEREWTVDSGVSISEEQDNRRPFGPFGPGFNQNNKSVQVATEITRYQIQSERDDLVTVEKTYELSAPATGNDEAYDMNGAGTWIFHKVDRVPESLDMKYQLVAKEGNSSVTFPITVKFNRLSAAELAKMEADAKRAQEELQRKLAEQKAKAEAPLTADEKSRVMVELASQEKAALKKVLTELAAKSPTDPDPEVAKAIQGLINHAEREIRQEARKALAKWSPEYKAKYDINKKYEGPSPVDSTDRAVESTTPLYVGQIVQVQEHGSFWFPARIKALQPTGKVEVEFMRWGEPGQSAVLARRNLQLAPDEVDQPQRPTSIAEAPRTATPTGASAAAPSVAPAEVATSAKMHTWGDASGRFQVVAEFVSAADGKVKLRRQDGRTVEVRLDQLNPFSRALAEALTKTSASENPFEPK